MYQTFGKLGMGKAIKKARHLRISKYIAIVQLMIGYGIRNFGIMPIFCQLGIALPPPPPPIYTNDQTYL